MSSGRATPQTRARWAAMLHDTTHHQPTNEEADMAKATSKAKGNKGQAAKGKAKGKPTTSKGKNAAAGAALSKAEAKAVVVATTGDGALATPKPTKAAKERPKAKVKPIRTKAEPIPMVRESKVENPCARVWELANEIVAEKGGKRDDVIRAAVAEGIATHTARTQYQKWLHAPEAT